MRRYLHIVTIIILNFTSDCGARDHVVYKSIGEQAHLTLNKHWNKTIVKWRKDHHLIAVVEHKNPNTKHPEKYGIDVSDNSLSIYNLMVNDSGSYIAQTGQWEIEVIKYQLIVQEAVSIPVISASHDHQSNSSLVCNMLVKCSADGESMMYNCDHQHCTRINATSTRVNITVKYTDDRVLECTASNRVSTKRTSIPMNYTCTVTVPNTGLVPNTTTNICIISIVVFGVLMICVIFFKLPKRKKRQEHPKMSVVSKRRK